MVFEAGLLSFLRTILIIVGVYLLFKLFFRYLVPYFLKLFIKKQTEKYREGFGRSNQNEDHKEGDISIKSRTSKGKTNDELGEYVDYEEVTDQ